MKINDLIQVSLYSFQSTAAQCLMQVIYDTLRMCLLLFVVLILAVLIIIVQLIIFILLFCLPLPPPLSILTRGHALMDEREVGKEGGRDRMESRRKRERGRDMRVKHQLVTSCMPPPTEGLNPQPGYVSWTGSESPTFCLYRTML